MGSSLPVPGSTKLGLKSGNQQATPSHKVDLIIPVNVLPLLLCQWSLKSSGQKRFVGASKVNR